MSFVGKITGKRVPLQDISPNRPKRPHTPLTELINGIATGRIEEIKKIFTCHPNLLLSNRYLDKISLFSLVYYCESVFFFLAEKHSDKESLLKIAIKRGHKEAVTLLFREFPNLEEEVFSWVDQEGIRLIRQLARMGLSPKSVNGETLLHHAALLGDHPLFSFLLKHEFSPIQADETGRTPIVLAIMGGNLAIVKACHTQSDKTKRFGGNEFPLLQTAVLWGNIEALKFLLYNGHDPKSVNGNHQNAMQLAAEKGQVAIMEELIQCGMKPKSTGYSETHAAAAAGNIGILRLLAKYDFIRLHRDQNGNTPVDLLVKNREAPIEVVEFFDRIGASFVSLNSNGVTPLHAAVSHNNFNVLEYFMQFENRSSQVLDVLRKRELKGKPFMGQRLSRVRDGKGNTLFHIAAEKGYRLLVQALFHIYPHFIQTRNNEGKVPIEMARDMKLMSLLLHLENELVYGKNFYEN